MDATAFRQVMGHFAAGVTVVTLPEPPDHGITVNAFCSVSLEPSLVLICIDHDTITHDRLSDGDDDGYCVNVLATDQRHLGEHFADIDTLDENPFETEPVTTAMSGAPIFEDSISFVDCSLTDAVTAGDHTIYIGEVETADILRPDAPPLTYYTGAWGSISAG